jgi:tetratricopeptide (TPR) repeat protein
MPLSPSSEFGSRDFDGSGERKIHSHFFPGANTGLPYLLSLSPRYREHADGLRRAVQAEADFLRGTDPEGKDRKVRIDLFGIKEGGSVDGRLHAPLRPELPTLEPGKKYLVEVVVRTLNLGHLLTEGTADSNELWVDVEARSGGRVLGRSGALRDAAHDRGPLDEGAHRMNILMLSPKGERINRRNPEDIFVPLYNHQILPGAAQVVHYELTLPNEALTEPVELRARVRYRKFDFEYMSLVHGGEDKVPALPVVDLCEDRVVLPVARGRRLELKQASPVQPSWERWNDYGIGLSLEGWPDTKRGELARAAEAFRQLLKEDKAAHRHAYVNLARVYKDMSRLEEARDAINRASTTDPPAPWWTVAWLTGEINFQNTRLDEAIANFEQVLDPDNQPRDSGFDFSLDYLVINELGLALFKRSQLEKDDLVVRDDFLRRAVEQFERTLALDSENADAHSWLQKCYGALSISASPPAGVAPGEGELMALAGALADGKQPSDQRLQAAERLLTGLDKLAERPQQRDRPKLGLLQLLLGPCRNAFRQDGDPALQVAAAAALARIHGALHALFVVDSNARGRAAAIYREAHPAADHASQAVVTYRLEPTGAR